MEQNRLESNNQSSFQMRQNRLENNNIYVIILFRRQNLLENIFPAQWKTEFQSYFSQKLLGSVRKNDIKSYFCVFNGYYIKIQKGIFPAVGITKTFIIIIILFCLFYLTGYRNARFKIISKLPTNEITRILTLSRFPLCVRAIPELH